MKNKNVKIKFFVSEESRARLYEAEEKLAILLGGFNYPLVLEDSIGEVEYRGFQQSTLIEILELLRKVTHGDLNIPVGLSD